MDHLGGHIREHRSLLASAEKRLLIRIARRLPASIHSDHLSALALLAMLAAGPAFVFIPLTPWAAAAFIGLLIVNWFGDSLDGTVARVRDQQRPRYGYYVDHVIDLVGTAALLAGMAASGLMTPAVAFALLAVYFMVAAESFLGTHALGVFRMSFAGFGPTELRLLLAAGAIKVAINPWVSIAGVKALLLDVGGVVAIVGLIVAFAVNAVRNSVALYKAEPIPRRTPPPNPRVRRFVTVGALGCCLQLLGLAVLVHVASWSWLPATIASVELAIVHNYLWHRGWTWGDRSGSFVRFNASTALTSIVGNVVLMALFAGVLGVPVVPANAIAIAIISAANFVLADRWVFLSLAFLLIAVPASAAPTPETAEAWRAYVARTEARLAEGRWEIPAPQEGPQGQTIDVGGGTISHWRGSVLIPHLTVDQLLRCLQHPGTPPPQEDVTASRVLARGPDSLRVYIQLVRRSIVTVTYETEHEMTFHRESPQLATARSVATRIDEAGGGDKGFLWRLNAYWRYQQTSAGVVVGLESLSLSRDVPLLIKPLAGRIVTRIARESMVRTLDALKAYAGSPPTAAARIPSCESSTALPSALWAPKRTSIGPASTTPTPIGDL